MSKATLKLVMHHSRLGEVSAALDLLGDLTEPRAASGEEQEALIGTPTTSEDDYAWHPFTVEEYRPLVTGEKVTFETARAVLDHLADRRGEWVDYKGVLADTGRTGTQHGAVTRWAKTQDLDTPWRRRWVRTTGDAGDTFYMLTDEAAARWDEAKKVYRGQ